MATRKTRKKNVEPRSRGLRTDELCKGNDAAPVRELTEKIEAAGGAVLAAYREPFGGMWMTFAALPIETVAPTPFQRDLSETHVKRLAEAIEQVGAFLDPIIAVATDQGEGAVRFWSPNGYHRLTALAQLGARSITALVSPDERLAYRILALNTEKAHNLREKSLETIRMARAMPPADRESDHAFEFEQSPFLTLGLCYEQRPRFSGGAYQPVLKRIDEFVDAPLRKTLAIREARAARLLRVDDKVTEIVAALKGRGFTSPYLRPFVVARLNPIRFSKAESFDFDDVLDRMEKSAGKFNADRVKQEDIARMGGGPVEDDGG